MRKFPTWLPALVIFAGGVVAMRAAHVGVFADQSSSNRIQKGAVETPAPDGSTTSSTFELTGRSYRQGDCVRWDQSSDAPDTRGTRVVPCDQPHLIEMTGRMTMPVMNDYPTELQWDAILDDGECGKQVATYLGGEIDPHGRFGVGAIRPTFRGWAAGDRVLWCGVQLRSFDLHIDADALEPFTGKVQSQPQAFNYPAGSCLAGEPATLTITGRVPCKEPHIYETVGEVDAGVAFSAPPPDVSAWSEKLNPACTALARTAFGGRIPKGVEASVSSIHPASWRTGSRRAQCDIARFDGGTRPVVLTAPLLPAR